MPSNKSYCPLAWNHFSVGTTGGMRICCNSWQHGLIKDKGKQVYLSDIKSPLEYFNLEQMKNIRKKMIDGERVDECQVCYDIEDRGGTSLRNVHSKRWPIENFLDNTNQDTGEIFHTTIHYIDFSWSNKCNLKCRMCTVHASDQLEEEFEKIEDLKKISQDYIKGNNVWDSNKTKDLIYRLVDSGLEEVLVTGGEPLINNDFFDFCQFLIKNNFSNNIVLSFHTNLNTMPQKWLNVFKLFKRTDIKVSIDAVGEMYEYVRYPGKWHIFERNLNRLAKSIEQNNNVRIEFHSVMSLPNFTGIPELFKYLLSLTIYKSISPLPYFNLVYSPNHARVDLIPLEIRQRIVNEIESILTENEHLYKMYGCQDRLSLTRSLCITVMSWPLPHKDRRVKLHNIISKVDHLRNDKSAKFMYWLDEGLNEIK